MKKIPAPVGGLNYLTSDNRMSEIDAKVLDNWIPDTGYCRVRESGIESADLSDGLNGVFPVIGSWTLGGDAVLDGDPDGTCFGDSAIRLNQTSTISFAESGDFLMELWLHIPFLSTAPSVTGDIRLFTIGDIECVWRKTGASSGSVNIYLSETLRAQYLFYNADDCLYLAILREGVNMRWWGGSYPGVTASNYSAFRNYLGDTNEVYNVGTSGSTMILGGNPYFEPTGTDVDWWVYQVRVTNPDRGYTTSTTSPAIPSIPLDTDSNDPYINDVTLLYQ